jgi:hypothetical protein
MIINKQINSKIEQPYFFYKGKFKNINSKYLIESIEKGCIAEDNRNFQTNIVGFMTSFTYFNQDKEFLKLLWQIFDVVDKDMPKTTYKLIESWGLVNGLSHYTKFHNHRGCYFSGVIYLNKHAQVLEFPEIKEEVKPEEGSFAIFSSFLKHGCSKRSQEEKPKYGISFNCNYETF